MCNFILVSSPPPPLDLENLLPPLCCQSNVLLPLRCAGCLYWQEAPGSGQGPKLYLGEREEAADGFPSSLVSPQLAGNS